MARVRLDGCVLEAHEAPLIARDGLRRAVGVVAHGERCVRLVLVDGGMGRVLPVREQEELREVRRLELAHNPAGYGIAVRADGFGRLQAYEADAARHIGLPAAEQHGVAVPHQEAVAGV